MVNVISLKPRKHIYELDNCSGCKEEITSDYREIGLPGIDNKEMKHIALCSGCYQEAEKEGVF